MTRITRAATAAWTAARTHTTVPLAVLAVGFTFSLAANVAWTWDGGAIRIAGGALASLALPGALHLWPRIPVAGHWLLTWRDRSWRVPVRRIVRATVMSLVAVLAAVTTFWHAFLLLIAHGETPWLAAFYPVITEAVVTMATLAVRGAHDALAAAADWERGAHELPDVPGVDPAAVRRARALLDREPRAGWRRVRDVAGLSEHYAKETLKALRPVSAVAS